MIDPIFLRRKVRLILAALPKEQRASERLLYDLLWPETPGIRVEELRTALEWNQSRGFVDYRHNQDEERDEWHLTERGWRKEGY